MSRSLFQSTAVTGGAEGDVVTIIVGTPTGAGPESADWSYQTADIETVAGAAIGGGQVKLKAGGMTPRFYGPDGVTTLKVLRNRAVAATLTGIADPLATGTSLAVDPTLAMFGAKRDGVTDDTAALNAAAAFAVAGNLELDLGTGTYAVTGTVQLLGLPRIKGGGANKCFIVSSSTTADIVVLGTGSSLGSRPNGYIRGVTIQGASSSPAQNGQAALKLNSLHQCRVEDVEVLNTDIGIDQVNNSFGTVYTNIRGGFGGSCNVGFYGRTGTQYGNDCTFINAWLCGTRAGVQFAPGSSGATFLGGQIVGGTGLSADDDTVGAVVLGKDYLAGTVGTMGRVKFEGTDFEASSHCWLFRAWGEHNLVVDGCALLGNGPSAAIGVMRTTDALQSKIAFRANLLGGTFSGATLLVQSGNTGSVFCVDESSWTVQSPLTVNGTSLSGSFRSLLAQAGTTYGHARYRDGSNAVTLLGGLRLRNNAGAFETSPDGTTWSPLATSAAVTSAVATETTRAQAAEAAFTASTAKSAADMHSLLGVSGDPAFFASTGILVAGVEAITKVPVKNGQLITSLLLETTTAGSADASVFAAVYNAAGVELARTADLGTLLNGAVGNKTAALTATFTTGTDGFVYVGLLGISGTTQPTLRITIGGASSSTLNFGLNANTNGKRSGTTGSGLAALPTSITPSALTASNRVFLIGLV